MTLSLAVGLKRKEGPPEKREREGSRARHKIFIGRVLIRTGGS